MIPNVNLQRLSSPEILDSPVGSVVLLDHGLIWPHPRLLLHSLPYCSSSRESLPCDLVWAGGNSFPTLLCISFSSCRLPYPGIPKDCIWLLLHPLLWPILSLQRFGSCNSTFISSNGSVTRLQSSLYATAWRVASPALSGRLLSSFHIISHLSNMSNITTWANSQFPWPDSHWLDIQHYRLRAENAEKIKIWTKR